MDIDPPPGWSIDSESTYTGHYIHTEHDLVVEVSPTYRARNRSGQKHDEVPDSYRVTRKQDWFSESVLGDQTRSAKVDTIAAAVETAMAFMEEFALEATTPGSGDTPTDRPESTRIHSRDPVTTGSEGLDSVLRGGLPRNRTVLLTGTPGAGKSTLAMQFLQAGIEADDRCLYISTEQTREEIYTSFDGFEFDTAHENLAITTIHSISSDTSDDVRVSALGEEDSRGDYRFDRSGVLEFLRRGVSADRVVLDSVSGLRAMAETDDEYRRSVLDIIRLFNDEFNATALLTAEFVGAPTSRASGVERVSADNTVQYTTHGVVRLWRERVGGEYRRFLDVMKMRGVDHDTRSFEVRIDATGLHVVSGKRTFTRGDTGRTRLSTGVDTLDEMLGGGLLRGGGALLEHDEQSSILPFLLAFGTEVLDEMMSIVVVPGTEIKPRRTEALFEEMGTDMRTLIERDQLFVVDTYGVWAAEADASENVVSLQDADDVRALFADIADRARGRGTCYFADVPSMVSILGDATTRRFRYWQEASLTDENDLIVDMANTDLLDPSTASFYANVSQFVTKQWVSPSGFQYLKVRKGVDANQGSVAGVEFVDDPPYVSLF